MSRSCLLIAAIFCSLFYTAMARADERASSQAMDKLDDGAARRREQALSWAARPSYAAVVFRFDRAFELRPEYRVVQPEPRHLDDDVWALSLRPQPAWSAPVAAAQRMIRKNAMLACGQGISKAAEADEQRRVRALTASELEKSANAQGLILTGDLVGAATLAAGFLSLHLNLGSEPASAAVRRANGSAAARLSLGVGLGRMGLRLRSEF